MLLRLYWPDALTSALWLAAAAVIACVGFRLARRISPWTAARGLDGDRHGTAQSPRGGAYEAELSGVAITGLLAVALSPVSWIHHLAWLVLVVGALLGDGRDARRSALAAVVWLGYVLRVPWWGATLQHSDWAPRFVARILQDSYGIGAIVLIAVLGSWLPKRLKQGKNSPSDDLDTKRRHDPVGTLGS
jgi:alpha-1,2-mannosyltransferase